MSAADVAVDFRVEGREGGRGVELREMRRERSPRMGEWEVEAYTQRLLFPSLSPLSPPLSLLSTSPSALIVALSH